MSSAEAAEFAKLADTTYRDVNIALANEFSRYADRIGVDMTEVIAAANSQPYSHIHQPGSRASAGTASRSTRTSCWTGRPSWSSSPWPVGSTTARSGIAIRSLQLALGGLDGAEVLVLGLTYRDGVKELAYSRALPLIERLAFHGATVLAYDPLLTDDEIARIGANAWPWGEPRPAVRAIVTQTADPAWRALDASWFPGLELVLDGRNSLRDLPLPHGVTYQGIGQRRP